MLCRAGPFLGVMPGLDPGIHAVVVQQVRAPVEWIAGPSPAMTKEQGGGTEVWQTMNRLALCKCDNGITHGACFKFVQGAWLFYWHAVEGADGEDYRANSVRAPFSDISARRALFTLENPRLSSLRKFALHACALTL